MTTKPATRQHGQFVTIECMTPAEYENGGEGLLINYSFAPTPFGEILIASTPKGICGIEFVDCEHPEALTRLKRRFPQAAFCQNRDAMQQDALQIFTQGRNAPRKIKLHLKATSFQLKVWEALLTIPVGGMATYGDIAATTGNPRACRTVGTAIGQNPVAYVIPCHRVIRASGDTGNYRWGRIRKKTILAREAAETKPAGARSV